MPLKNIQELRVIVSETERTTAEVLGEIRVAPFVANVFAHHTHLT